MDTRTRQEKRDDIKAHVMEKAHNEIARVGRSSVCRAGNHDRCVGGPKQHDTCICECHDKDEDA